MIRAPIHRTSQAVLSVLVGCLLLVSCGRIGNRPPDPAAGDLFGFSAPQRLDAPQWALVWRGDWRSGQLELSAVADGFPRGTDLTLAIVAPRPVGSLTLEAGQATGDVLARALLDVQNQGAIARGIHISLEPPEAEQGPGELTDLADWLEGVRGRLGNDFELSWTVPWLEPESVTGELDALKHAVDWFAVRTYGQRADLPDETALWDLSQAMERLDAAEQAGVAYRGVIRVGGSIAQRSESGLALIAKTLPCDVFKELADRSESFFQFEGYFRQVFEADPRLRVLRIGDQELSVGDRLRVNRTTVDHLRHLFARIDERADEGYLGHLILDLGTDERDCLTLDLAEIALAALPLARQPEVSVERLGRDRYRVRVDAGSEMTGLARSNHNFVDVIADEGTILDVEMDGFVRFEFIDRQGRVAPGLLGTGVRIYVPLLDPGQSAEAILRTRAHRTGFDLTPRFISPTGATLPSQTQRWTPDDGRDPPARGAER